MKGYEQKKKVLEEDEKPNYDLSSEQSVLGNLLSEDAKETIPRIARIFGNLGKEVFYSGKHRTIYQGITELHEQNRKTHPKIVADYLKDESSEDIPLAYLRQLQTDQDVGAGITEELARRLTNLAVRRKTEMLGVQIQHRVKAGKEIPDIVEFTETELDNLKRNSNNEKKSMTLWESLNTPIKENPAPIGGGLLVPGRYTIIAATDGEGKTTLCLQLALCAVTATTFLSRFPIKKPVKVLYFCGENSRGDINQKARKQIEALTLLLRREIKQEELKNLIMVESQNIDFLLDKKEGQAFLNNWLEKHKPDIVIFDPLNNFISDDDTLNSDTIARKTAKTLNKIAVDYNCFPILTTHFKKKQEDGTPEISPDNVFSMFHGSKYWTNPAVSQIALTRAHKQKYPTAKRIHFKFKTETEVSPMLLLRGKSDLWYEEISRDEMSKAKLNPSDLVEILKIKCGGECIPSIFREIAAKALDCSQTQIRELLKVAKKQGVIVEKGGMLRVVEFTKQGALSFEKK